MEDSVYHHKRTLQCVRLGKVLLDSRVRPRAKGRAVISFANGAAAEASNCKCKITLSWRHGGQRRGDSDAQIIFGDAAQEPSHSDGEECWLSEVQRTDCCPVLSGSPRLTLCLAAAPLTHCESSIKQARSKNMFLILRKWWSHQLKCDRTRASCRKTNRYENKRLSNSDHFIQCSAFIFCCCCS